MNHSAFDTQSLDMPSVDIPATPTIAPLDEPSRAELCDFLATVANSEIKVKILRLFLSEPGLCLSTPALADRVGSSIFETRKAVQQLDGSGALNYCPHFAFTDLCTLSLARLPQPMQQKLGLLLKALRRRPELVWGAFKSEELEQEETKKRAASSSIVRPMALMPGIFSAKSDRP